MTLNSQNVFEGSRILRIDDNNIIVQSSGAEALSAKYYLSFYCKTIVVNE